MDQVEETIRKHLGRLSIVVGAMGMGVLVFGVVAVMVGPLALPEDQGLPEHTLAIVCAVLMVVEGIVYIMVRGQIQRKVPARTDAAGALEALKAFTSVSVIGWAMAEGIALFGGVVVMLEGVGVNILLVAIPFAALLIQLPTWGRWESFLERVRGAQVR